MACDVGPVCLSEQYTRRCVGRTPLRQTLNEGLEVFLCKEAVKVIEIFVAGLSEEDFADRHGRKSVLEH